MISKWTPGPWFAELEFIVARQSEYGPVTRDSSVAICYPNNYVAERDYLTFRPENDPELMANARLIAAAPDLYEALAFLRSMVLSGEHYSQRAQEIVEGALNKANGKIPA